MIKKNDILMYNENLQEGDDACLMIALEDETTPSKVSMVKTRELNTSLVIPPSNFFESRFYKVVGHAEKTDTAETLVRRFLPKNKWRFEK